MVKLNPAELHLLVLISTNPDHPQTRELIDTLSDTAKAIAVLMLRESNQRGVPHLPRNIESNPGLLAQVKTAAKEFLQMAAARQAEHIQRRRPIPA